VRYRIFLALAASAVTFNASAERIQLGRNPAVGGVSVSCLGISTWVDDQIPDIAIAAPGAIVLNPALFNWPPVAQIFVYSHECAHQIPAIGSNENAADCWAVKLGRNQGWLTPQGLAVVQAYFMNSSGDWTHLPGQLRIQQMQACYLMP
jgi:hypothetical protein